MWWRVAVVVCFCGAAFLGVAGESADANPVITVLNERLGERPIDVKQGGQFIEPLCNLIPAMLAQQVANDSFEEEPPYKVAYKAETDKPFRPWYPDGAVHKAQFSLETDKPFNGKRSQKIAIPLARCRAGISQDGFSLKKGLHYRVRLHARGEGSPLVRVWLHGDGETVAAPAELGRASDAWAPMQADLEALRDINNATLTIDTEGPGTVFLDRVSLIGEDAVLGIWRPDVIQALKDMNPGIVRWGGSTTEGYEWSECIGNWDLRAPFTTCWGGLEPNFVGMEEFVQLCRHIDADPLLCIRWSGKTPEDGAAQVEYFNGAASTKWGAARAANGHAEPYAVKYWQIGNEVGGKEYDKSVHGFAEAMKKADPSIKILSAFTTEHTLEQGGDYLDYLCPHHYGCEDLAGKEKEFKALAQQIAQYGGGRDVRVAVTEWNTTAGDWGLGRGMLQTLWNALSCSRYQNLMHRYAGLVEIAIRSNLADSFGSGVLVTGTGWLYCAPTYYAQQLYQRAAGSFVLRLQNAPDAGQPDVSAVLSPDGQALRIYAVNQQSEPRAVSFQISGFPKGIVRGSAIVLKDRDDALCAEVMNTRDDPRRIGYTERPLQTSEAACTLTLDPLSLSLLELTLDR